MGDVVVVVVGEDVGDVLCVEETDDVCELLSDVVRLVVTVLVSELVRELVPDVV